MSCSLPSLCPLLPSMEQDKVTREWNEMAGEWDDVAAAYADSLYAHFVERQILLVPEAKESDGNNTSGTTTTTTLHDGDNSSSSSKRVFRIVDFGCGTGLLTERIIRHHQQQHSAVGTAESCRLEILALDASPRMVQILREKIRDCEWTVSVHVIAIVLGQMDLDADDNNAPLAQATASAPTAATTTTAPTAAEMVAASNRQAVLDWYETADLVVASNVLACIPKSDRSRTLSHIARLLRPNGVFCHADWAATETPSSFSNSNSNSSSNTRDETDDVPPSVPPLLIFGTSSSQHQMARDEIVDLYAQHQDDSNPSIEGGSIGATKVDAGIEVNGTTPRLQLQSLEMEALKVTRRRNDPPASVWIGVAQRKQNL